MTHGPHNTANGLWGRILRILLLWVLLPLCLTAIATCASLALLCAYKPDVITPTLQYHLRAATGLPWRIRGAVKPSLWPYPGISVTDVRIAAASIKQEAGADVARPLLHARDVLIYFEPASILKFQPVFQHIEIVSPLINLTYDQNKQPLWLPPDNDDTEQKSAIIQVGTNNTEKFKQAAVFCALPSSLTRPLRIRDGTLVSWTPDGRQLMSFNGIEADFTPEKEENLHLSAAFELPDADLSIRFAIKAMVGCNGMPATGSISGEIAMIPPGSRTLTARFASSLHWLPTGKDITMPDFSMESEGDTLSAKLTADLALAKCVGRVDIERLSLTRWFGFARVLPPGLREALHNLAGSFDLELDLTKAEAHNLDVTAGSLAARGYVGAPDLSAPVVVVDVNMGSADLDPIFPFLASAGSLIPEPTPPVFDHPALAPYPEPEQQKDGDAADRNSADRSSGSNTPSPDKHDDFEVGYNITIKVAKPRVHDTDGGPLTVTVLPVTVRETQKTRVGINAEDLLNGSVTGHLDIDSKNIIMHYAVKGLELALLPENRDNTVHIAGSVTGDCDMVLPFLANSDIADTWDLGINATVKSCAVTGFYDKSPWRLHAETATVSGKGSIFSVLEKGVRIEGLWNLGANGLNTTWNPKGSDNVQGAFNGGLFWPPIKGDAQQPNASKRSMERKGLDRLTGKLNLDGSLIVPLGSLLVPVSGKLNTSINWLPHDKSIRLQDMGFTGIGSFFQGNSNIDFSGSGVAVSVDSSLKINPRELLKHWNIRPPDSVRAPRVLSGRVNIESKGRDLSFKNINVEADGAPISGSISWQKAPPGGVPTTSGHWIFRLAADHLDLDALLPPDTPENKAPPARQKLWNLTALKGLSIDAQMNLTRTRRNKLLFTNTKAIAALQHDRFSVHCESMGFYDGTAVLLFQGSVMPERSQITLRKGLMKFERINLGKLLKDFTGDTQYGGSADLMADFAGSLTRDADIPAQLSGVWSLNVKDGLYPSFIGGTDSTLRNSFSLASTSGPLEKGILRTENFTLSGPMVDMSGRGWYDLTHKKYDINVSATFAKVPTVPMRFYGNGKENNMSVRGAVMVVETMQAAGSTVFDLVKGVLSLPAYAIQGMGAMFDGNTSSKKQKPQVNKQPAVTRPVGTGK